jgi:putative redox protein
MKFRGTSGDNPEIITDYTPPFGDGEGYTSLELFLVSACSCLGGGVAVLMRKMHKSLEALTVSAEGVRREQHPTSFESITFSVRVKSADATAADVEKAVELAEPICPVLAMMKGNVKLTTQVEVNA